MKTHTSRRYSLSHWVKTVHASWTSMALSHA